MKQPIPSNSLEPLKLGDEVRIVPEWQDPGDEKYRTFVIEAPENCSEVRIQTVVPGLFFQPTEWIRAGRLLVLSPEGGQPTIGPSDDESENQTPTRPDLIPGDESEARLRLDAVVLHELPRCSNETFLRAWWALCWLNPGLHPDDHEQWEDEGWKPLAAEAFRRFKSGQIDDSELYPAEATHNRIWKERKAVNSATYLDPNRRVVIRTTGGIYLSRNGQPTPNKAEAARYLMITDQVEEQIAKVRELQGMILIIEDDPIDLPPD